MKDGIVGLAGDVAHLVWCCRNQQKMKMRLGFGSVFGACLGALVVVPHGGGAVLRKSLPGFFAGKTTKHHHTRCFVITYTAKV